MQLLRLNKIDKLYNTIKHKKGSALIDSLIEKLEVKFDINPKDLTNIPTKGAFISIANHPFGGIDGLLLLKFFLDVRPDFKILQNRSLKKITPLSDSFVVLNPKNNIQNTQTDIKLHLKNKKALGIFPADEVSSIQHSLRIEDKRWNLELLRFIKKQNLPIIPVYFQGKNSMIFQLLGLIHNNLRTAKLPSELLNKKRKIIKVRIGNPVSVEEQKQLKRIDRFGRYLRTYVYALGTSLEVKKFYQANSVNNKVEKIIPQVDINLLERELVVLKNNYLLFSNRNYEVYCAPTFLLPNIHKEIGRLRECTFRKVGEGTNREIDIDEYDLYYHQLFIWDTKSKKIVGGYRIGKGKEIIQKYGIKGFYIYSLFNISKPMFSKLNEAIELGRSFIIKEYQKKTFSLYLLWKGIFYFVLKNTEYQYLIGPVSISNEYSNLSKNLIINFIMEYHFNYKLAQYINPEISIKLNLKGLILTLSYKLHTIILIKLTPISEKLNLPMINFQYSSSNTLI